MSEKCLLVSTNQAPQESVRLQTDLTETAAEVYSPQLRSAETHTRETAALGSLGSEAAEAAVPGPQLSTFPPDTFKPSLSQGQELARVEQRPGCIQKTRPPENGTHCFRESLCRYMGRPETGLSQQFMPYHVMYEHNKKYVM